MEANDSNRTRLTLHPYLRESVFLVSCVVQFEKRQAFVSSASKFQVQISTPGGPGALPKNFRISYVYVEFSDATLNHRFEDPRPYTQDDALQDGISEVRVKDRTGQSLEWIDCKNCILEQSAVEGSNEERAPQSVWRKTTHLDIRPFESKVIEGIIIPEKEQIIKVTCSRGSLPFL